MKFLIQQLKNEPHSQWLCTGSKMFAQIIACVNKLVIVESRENKLFTAN